MSNRDLRNDIIFKLFDDRFKFTMSVTETCKEVADVVGMNWQTVYQIIRKNQPEKIKHAKSRKRYVPDRD